MSSNSYDAPPQNEFETKLKIKGLLRAYREALENENLTDLRIITNKVSEDPEIESIDPNDDFEIFE
ncbi:hypothetical protein [Hirschia maritima]|uniref:hypothetical protein n=1 Tax=Hirschia maritima TaxID=1121961 RepID=UPI000378AC70|nr:hypothetical protein [Hirschia maritima]